MGGLDGVEAYITLEEAEAYYLATLEPQERIEREEGNVIHVRFS